MQTPKYRSTLPQYADDADRADRISAIALRKNLAEPDKANEIDAWARHASASNGFADIP